MTAEELAKEILNHIEANYGNNDWDLLEDVISMCKEHVDEKFAQEFDQYRGQLCLNLMFNELKVLRNGL